MTRLHCDARWLRDDDDRIVLLRGANVSGRSKTPPFLPLADPADLDRLAAWGMNAIRLLVTWEAIEPERGAYDDDYLAAIEEIARAAGERGIHVILDFHQDLFARAYGGDGAPRWATAGAGARADGRRWFWYYALSRGVQRSFAAFWRDDDGLRTAFFGAVQHTMRTLAHLDCIVGWDLFNEPMGSMLDVATGAFERESLTAFHRASVELRDREAPGRLLFVEPTPLVAFGAPSRLGAITGDDLVYAPHLYDASALLASRFLPKVSTVPPTLRQIDRDGDALQWPTVIGELGVLNGVHGADVMMEDQCSRLDRAFVGWLVWHYNPSAQDWNDEDASIVDPDGSERPWTSALVRPYPRALAGTPVRWESRRERGWTLEYDATSRAATELVIPARYDHAPRWRCEGGDADLDGNVLFVRSTPGARVRITLSR